jgi:hypothetical protein
LYGQSRQDNRSSHECSSDPCECCTKYRHSRQNSGGANQAKNQMPSTCTQMVFSAQLLVLHVLRHRCTIHHLSICRNQMRRCQPSRSGHSCFAQALQGHYWRGDVIPLLLCHVRCLCSCPHRSPQPSVWRAPEAYYKAQKTYIRSAPGNIGPVSQHLPRS